MTLVLATTALAFAVYAVFRMPKDLPNANGGLPWYFWSNVSSPLTWFMLLTAIFAFWHFWDVIDRRNSVARWSRILTNYPAFLISMTPLCMVAVVNGSNLLMTNSCQEMPLAMHFECGINSPDWLIYLTLAALIVVTILSFAKMIVAIQSLARPFK